MEIGGYFGLQLPAKEPYYPDLISLNSGRSCLEYILRAGGYSNIYVPYYICDVVLEPIQRLGLNVEFYEINSDFTIKKNITLRKTEVLLYVNYYGLMDDYISSLASNFNNLIIDNAQAFYSKPLDNVITYYSPRKFFGVSDGGYLSTKTLLQFELEKDTSYQNAIFLLTRLDVGAERAYQDFRTNEVRLSTVGLKRMSNLTTNILSSIDYALVKQKREANFKYIHQELGFFNQLNFIPKNPSGPMIYPFLTNKIGLREYLISKKVFVAKYWENVTQLCPKSSFENKLATQLVALPIDQRYGVFEMKYLVDLVKSYCIL